MDLTSEDPADHVWVGDCLDCPLPGGSVDLAVTSPPYNTGKTYDDDLTTEQYLEFLCERLERVAHQLRPGGWLALNTTNVGRKPYVPYDAYLIDAIGGMGLDVRGQIVWDKGASAGGSCAWGSWMSPTNPVLRDNHEIIVAARKPGEGPDPPIPHTWQMKAASARRLGHPAPFPLDLPSRCIDLLCPPDGLVYDPFAGVGTSLVAALAAGMNYVGAETVPAYARNAVRRLEAFSSGDAYEPADVEEEGLVVAFDGTSASSPFGVSDRACHDSTRFYSSKAYDGVELDESPETHVGEGGETAHAVYVSGTPGLDMFGDLINLVPNRGRLFVAFDPSAGPAAVAGAYSTATRELIESGWLMRGTVHLIGGGGEERRTLACVFCKGTFGRKKLGRAGTIDKPGFLKWTKSVWRGGSLAEGLIQLYTFADDTVCVARVEGGEPRNNYLVDEFIEKTVNLGRDLAVLECRAGG